MKVLIPFLFTFISFSSFGQFESKAKKIIDEYIEAVGGIEKISAIKSMEKKELSYFGNTPVKSHSIVVFPDKHMYESSSESYNQKIVYKDGEISIIAAGTEVKNEDDTLNLESAIDSYIYPLLYLEELADSLIFSGTNKYDSTDCDEVKIVFKNGITWLLDFDNSTRYLYSMFRGKTRIFLSDYRPINGVQIPYKGYFKSEHGYDVKIFTEKIEINKSYSPDYFTLDFKFY